MASYVNSTPKGYMLNGATDAADWLTRTLDIEGHRIDDVKGMAVDAVRHLLDSKSMSGRFAVGEYFDGNPQALKWWVWDSGMDGRCKVFDFTLHWAIQTMCNSASRWWMGALQGAGYIALDPMNAVTFVDNPDTDLSPGENVIWNKLLGYALILTAEGYPSVYYKDYSTDRFCYGLKPFIDNLIWIHENLAFGTTLTRWGNDPQVYIFERQGYPGLLVGLNNDANNSYKRTVQTSFGPNIQLHDYTGKHGDIWTDGQGRATFTLPPNKNGQSYLCLSRTGYAQAFSLNQRTTTQTFFGAGDLDIGPAENGNTVQTGRIWCEKGTPIEAELRPSLGNQTSVAGMSVGIVDAQGRVVATGSPSKKLKATASQSGWFSLHVTGRNVPTGSGSYELTVTYTSTQQL